MEDVLSEKQWSISELARRSGVSQSHLSNVISGNRRASATTLAAIARALNLPAEVAFVKAGLLPSGKGVKDDLEKEWQHIFSQALSRAEQKELITRARFEMEQIKKRR